MNRDPYLYSQGYPVALRLPSFPGYMSPGRRSVEVALPRDRLLLVGAALKGTRDAAEVEEHLDELSSDVFALRARSLGAKKMQVELAHGAPCGVIGVTLQAQ